MKTSRPTYIVRGDRIFIRKEEDGDLTKKGEDTVTNPQEDQPERQSVQWLLQKTPDDERLFVLQGIAARVFRAPSVRLDLVREIYMDREGQGAILVTVDYRVYAVDAATGTIRPVRTV